MSAGPRNRGRSIPEFMAKALRRAALGVHGTAATFAGWTELFMTRPNELPDFGQEMFQRAGGDPEIFYLHGYWTLEPGEAWVIETAVPDCPYWNFQLDNWWMESLDHGRRITVNKHTARTDDGRLTIVVAERDPGWGNWIDTAGPLERHRAAALARRHRAPDPELPGDPAVIRAGELLDAARERTGLADYGDEWFVEPLNVLVGALNEEARLSELGLELTRRRLTALLADRLRLKALQAEHPEIRDTEVTVAAEICGLPRTGSTLLHRLLAASPKLTSTLSWETSYPLPFPGEGPDAAERKRRARERAKLFLDMSPDFAGIHTIEWDGPEEDVILLDRTFTSMSFDSFYAIPSYGALAARDRPDAGLPRAARVAAGAAVAGPGPRGARPGCSSRRTTSWRSDTVLDTFPGCRIVMTHRSPASAVPSYASMVVTIVRAVQRGRRPAGRGPVLERGFADTLRAFDGTRSRRPGAVRRRAVRGDGRRPGRAGVPGARRARARPGRRRPRRVRVLCGAKPRASGTARTPTPRPTSACPPNSSSGTSPSTRRCTCDPRRRGRRHLRGRPRARRQARGPRGRGEGAKVVMAARSTTVTAAVAKEVAAAGGEAVGVACDVRRPDEVAGVVRTAVDRFGTVTGLVNSAYSHPGFTDLLDTPDKQLRRSLDIILHGALEMTRAVVPHMTGGGSIVNIGTMSTRKPHAWRGRLRGGQGGDGVRHAVPGAGARRARHPGQPGGAGLARRPGRAVLPHDDRERARGHASRTCTTRSPRATRSGRIPTDEACAGAVLFLLSRLASEVTGAVLDVNGGEYMPA